jgi:hypothetical protein
VERVLNFNKIGAPPWFFHSRILRSGRINKLTLKIFDKSVWIWRRLDGLFPWKGLSLIVVARKNETGGAPVHSTVMTDVSVNEPRR